MSIRIPESPIVVYPPGSIGNSDGIAGVGADGFSLYTALRDAKRSLVGGGNMLVSWPWDVRLETNTTGTILLSNQRVMLVPQLVKGGLQIDGVAWVQTTAGVYTANNNNKIGAYTYDGTTFTRVAQCANDGTLWKGAAAYTVKAFTTPYTPSQDMLLWAAGIWNQSAVVTQPQIGGHGATDAGAKNLGLGNFALHNAAPGLTDLSATIANAALDTSTVNAYWLAFYHAY